jgi:hypothetical protein
MCAGSSNVKSRSVSLTFASTGRDSCFPAYSLSLSIISVFPVSPFARDQRRYLRDQGISPDRFLSDCQSSFLRISSLVTHVPFRLDQDILLAHHFFAVSKRLSGSLTTSGPIIAGGSIKISLGQSHWLN